MECLDLRDVVLVGHSYAGIPVGQAAERIGDRPTHVVFTDCPLPADGDPSLSDWPDGGRKVKAAMAENRGFRPPPDGAGYERQGLTDAQVARITARSTPHPGTTLTEPTVLTRTLAGVSGTYVTCVLNDAETGADAAEPPTGGHRRPTAMETGHRPMSSRPREPARVLLDTAPSRGRTVEKALWWNR